MYLSIFDRRMSKDLVADDNVKYDIDDYRSSGGERQRYSPKSMTKYRQTTMKLIDDIFSGKKNISLQTLMLLKRTVKKILEEENWPNSLKLKTGAALISMLLETAKRDDDSPAFIHCVSWEAKGRIRVRGRPKISVGVIKLDDGLLEILQESKSAIGMCFDNIKTNKNLDVIRI